MYIGNGWFRDYLEERFSLGGFGADLCFMGRTGEDPPSDIGYGCGMDTFLTGPFSFGAERWFGLDRRMYSTGISPWPHTLLVGGE